MTTINKRTHYHVTYWPTENGARMDKEHHAEDEETDEETWESRHERFRKKLAFKVVKKVWSCLQSGSEKPRAGSW